MKGNTGAMRQARMLSGRMQQLYDRYDLLNEACYNLRWAADALTRSRDASGGDNLAALEQITTDVSRSRDHLRAQLERLERYEQQGAL